MVRCCSDKMLHELISSITALADPASSLQSNCINGSLANAGNAPPISMQTTGGPAPYKHLPEDPFAPPPFKGSSSSTDRPAQPTYPCFPGQLPIGRPPPPTKPPSTFKRSLPFDESPMGHPFATTCHPSALTCNPFVTTSHPFAFGPISTTPQGTFLNPAFRAGPSTYSAVHPSYANIQGGMAPWPMPASVHALPPRPPYVQPQANFYTQHLRPLFRPQVQPVSMPGRQPVPGQYAKALAVSASPHYSMDAAHRHTSASSINSAAHASCSDGTAISGTKAAGLQTQPTNKPGSQGSAKAAEDKQDCSSGLQADRLSSWCHVKRSRGETPNLSKDAVKSLVQVHSLSCCPADAAVLLQCSAVRSEWHHLHTLTAVQLYVYIWCCICQVSHFTGRPC